VMKQGYKVTTPLRALIDVIEDGVLAGRMGKRRGIGWSNA
jgi:hypothetical protein